MPLIPWPTTSDPWSLLPGPWSLLVLLAMGQSLLLTLQAWEHRRFVRGRLKKPPPGSASRRILLVAPCKGLELGLEENLRPLLEQDHANYEVAFIVESEYDPACAAIRRLIEHSPTPARLIVAGRSRDHGQKVHNLLAATDDLPPRIEVLAFADSDARPAHNWLRTLTARLEDRAVGATTAYRVLVPVRCNLPALLLASLNSVIAGLFGPGGRHVVWGGSWAVRRDVFEAISLRTAWHGTLSDDLVASRELRRAGLGIEFEPGCMTASPIDYGWRASFEFLRRQFVITRCYMPGWWLGALAMVALAAVGFWGSVAGTGIALSRGTADAAVFATLGLTLYGLGIIRALLRQQAARLYRPDLCPALRSVRRIELFAGPVLLLVGLLGLVSSVFTRRVKWRGNSYYIGAAGQVRLLAPGQGSEMPPPHFCETRSRVRNR